MHKVAAESMLVAVAVAVGALGTAAAEAVAKAACDGGGGIPFFPRARGTTANVRVMDVAGADTSAAAGGVRRISSMHASGAAAPKAALTVATRAADTLTQAA